MSDTLMGQAIVYLTAALICVPVAKRLGMGSVLGYLLAGILIGPFALGFVGPEQVVVEVAAAGVNFVDYLTRVRMEHAMAMLAHPEPSIAAVAGAPAVMPWTPCSS